MSILKIIKGQERNPKAKQPASWGEAGERAMPNLLRRRDYHPYFWVSVAVLGSVLCAMAAVSYWWLASSSPNEKGGKAPVAFAMKVVDDEGRPVAGAQVSQRERLLGVTDSFGEWRRTFHAQSGARVSLSFAKDTSAGRLQTRETFVIPVTLPGQRKEMAATIQLAGKRHERRGLAAAAQAGPSQDGAQAQPAGQAGAPDAGGASSGQLAITPAGKARFAGPAYRNIWFRSVTMTAGAQLGRQAIIERSLVPALLRQSRAAGLNPLQGSPWQVALSHVPYPQAEAGFPGMLRVRAPRPGGDGGELDFLIAYTGRADTTAQAVLRGLATHVAAYFPVHRFQDAWYVGEDPGLPQLWRLRAGAALVSEAGDVLRVAPLGRDKMRQLAAAGVRVAFAVQLPDASASLCRDASLQSCFASTPAIPRYAPAASWRSARMKVYGIKPDQSTVYVAGYQAVYEGEQVWRFWQEPGKNAYLSVIKNGVMVFRKKLNGLQPALQMTSVPQPALSRR